MSDLDDFLADDLHGMTEHYTSFPDDHGDLCAACGRVAFGLLCESCERAADRVRA